MNRIINFTENRAIRELPSEFHANKIAQRQLVENIAQDRFRSGLLLSDHSFTLTRNGNWVAIHTRTLDQIHLDDMAILSLWDLSRRKKVWEDFREVTRKETLYTISVGKDGLVAEVYKKRRSPWNTYKYVDHYQLRIIYDGQIIWNEALLNRRILKTHSIFSSQVFELSYTPLIHPDPMKSVSIKEVEQLKALSNLNLHIWDKRGQLSDTITIADVVEGSKMFPSLLSSLAEVIDYELVANEDFFIILLEIGDKGSDNTFEELEILLIKDLITGSMKCLDIKTIFGENSHLTRIYLEGKRLMIECSDKTDGLSILFFNAHTCEIERKFSHLSTYKVRKLVTSHIDQKVLRSHLKEAQTTSLEGILHVERPEGDFFQTGKVLKLRLLNEDSTITVFQVNNGNILDCFLYNDLLLIFYYEKDRIGDKTYRKKVMNLMTLNTLYDIKFIRSSHEWLTFDSGIVLFAKKESEKEFLGPLYIEDYHQMGSERLTEEILNLLASRVGEDGAMKIYEKSLSEGITLEQAECLVEI